MAAVSGSAGQQPGSTVSREGILLSMQAAGIRADDPLGVLLLQAFEANARADKELGAMTEVLRGATEQAVANLAARETILDKMIEAGQVRIKAHETITTRQKEDTINKLVLGLQADLGKAVFAELKQRLPLHEKAAYRAIRLRAMAQLAAVAGLFAVLGFWSGYTADEHARRMGRYCAVHQQAAGGLLWCQLSDPGPSGSVQGQPPTGGGA